VVSVALWINAGQIASYAASEAAAWSLTNSLRNELLSQGIRVLALHMGFVDTDMARQIDMPKTSANEIVGHALDGLEAGLSEVLEGLVAATSVYVPQGG
jgi:NAD(P)-dependent dehydrogenase (short-subunit alcohol dehydrogenase family)